MNEHRRYLRSDAAESHCPALERRLWAREPVRGSDARLTWRQDEGLRQVRARLVDLSPGGAGVLVPSPPPRDAVLRLSIEGVEGASVAGRAVGVRTHHKDGWLFLHVKFVENCPRSMLERVIGLDDPGF